MVSWPPADLHTLFSCSSPQIRNMVYTESAHSASFDKLLRSAGSPMVAGSSHVGQRTGVISVVAHEREGSCRCTCAIRVDLALRAAILHKRITKTALKHANIAVALHELGQEHFVVGHCAVSTGGAQGV